MLSYIKGIITQIDGNSVVIENSNIGYLIKSHNPYAYTIGEVVTIYTYLHLREDLIELYGFQTIEEKNLFLQLISVKGLGPKGALSILASGNILEVINAINRGDAKYLQRFPGIGAKASQQIILDLHGKINLNQSPNKSESIKTTRIKDALKNLGYSGSEIKAVTDVIEENLDKDDKEIIKIALISLRK